MRVEDVDRAYRLKQQIKNLEIAIKELNRKKPTWEIRVPYSLSASHISTVSITIPIIKNGLAKILKKQLEADKQELEAL